MISTDKGTLNLSDIQSTSLDEAIDIAEQFCARTSYENTVQFEELAQKVDEENATFSKILNKFDIEPKPAHPMFMYDELE